MELQALLGLLIPLMPLAGFLFITAFTRKHKMLSAVVSIMAIGTSAVMAYFLLISQINAPREIIINLKWLEIADISMSVGAIINQLTVIMLVVVTTVSMLVQIYSIGYMHGDEGFSKFFSFISLFSFSMLGIVIANNLIQIYIFWELVGLCSYLLIGFWYHKPEAAEAAKKAFIVTRFGDFGFLIGILWLSFLAKSFDFKTVEHFVLSGAIDPATLTIIVLLLFSGAMGKSGQFPLHVWLPDAMEGPTPVSALIHAATMVAAGVFMVARLFGIFDASPDAMLAVAYIGGFTAIFAASIAGTQDDIKRVLAYSTLSQLGYMMMALGVGGYTAGMFHLTTHAFFKALLFLGAGSVIHAVHSNSIWDMGGLHKKMPITSITFFIAVLAISGIFPLSGFWSKDEILLAAKNSGQPLLYYGAIITAFLTAFYMSRIYFVTFLGKEKEGSHAHESPLTMTVPLMILAVFSVFSGLVDMPGLEKNIGTFLYHGAQPHETALDMGIAVTSSAVAVAGILIAFIVYGLKWIKAENLAKAAGPIYILLKRKYFIDELYMAIIKGFYYNLSAAIKWFDRHVVDGMVNLVAFLCRWAGAKLKYTVSGKAQDYALIITGGFVVILVAVALYNPDLMKMFGGR